MNAFEGLTNLVTLIIESISKRKRLLAFVFFLIVFSLIFLYFESHTRLIYYSSLERKISLVNQLNELAKDDIALNTELNPIYSELSKELLDRKVTPMEFPTITTLILYKFLTGASFGLLFLLIGLLYRRPKAMQGALLVALFFGIVGIFFPIVGSIWVNLTILMIGQLLLLVALAPKKDSHNTPHTA
jgi:hypothetical protein